MKKNKEKKTNPILWFLFSIVIPLIFIVGLVIVILSFTNFSIVKYAKDKEIPVISSLITSEEGQADKKRIEKAETIIEDQENEITDLVKEIQSLESIIDQLEEDIIKLENKTDSEENLTLEEDSADEEAETIKKMAASFRKMKNKQAALIVQDLEKDTALQIMEQLPNDTRGSILEAMEPKQAAQLTELFIKENE